MDDVQQILIRMHPVYSYNRCSVSTIHVRNKTCIKRNILTIQQNNYSRIHTTPYIESFKVTPLQAYVA